MKKVKELFQKFEQELKSDVDVARHGWDRLNTFPKLIIENEETCVWFLSCKSA